MNKILSVLYDIFIGQWLEHSVHCECTKCWPEMYELVYEREKEDA